jgi:4-amino-4-deoxychorismate lyase
MNGESLVLVDGENLDFFPVDDRGLMYGDGVFRTLRVVGSTPRWWDEQLLKLTDDCIRLGLKAPEAAEWNADLAKMCSHLSDGVMKLVVTRGSGPRGYRPPVAQKSRRLMRYDAVIHAAGSEAISARVCALKLGWQPRLAGIKHLNRLENVLARAEWNTPEFDEGLLLDQSEQVISGVMSNLFIWRNNRLQTPKLDHCGVAGVARARLMRLARTQGLQVEEINMNLQSVLDAEEVMLTNSLWGLRRVGRIESKTWIQPIVSTQLSAWLNA